MKGKRTLSLLLSLLMAFSLFAGIAPQAQANDLIGDLLDQYFFKKDYLDSLFNESNLVKQGTCGKGAGANVWYQIYEISAADLSDTAFFKTLADYSADGYLQLDPAEDYYGVKIFGNGEMENYKRNGYSAPWCDKIQLDRGEHAGETVDMDKKLILGYIAGPGDFKVLNNGHFTTASYKTGVTNVGQFAFFGQDMLTAVYLGESVKRIEDRAFESTEMLAAINMPSALEYLGKRAFYGCDKLTYWRAGACSKLTKIGERAFYGNSLLATVQFPQSLQVIDKMAFAWCRILGDENFVLPSSLTTIGDGAFMFDTHMGRINEINIPKNVLTIGSYAFLCCFGIGKGENDGLSFTSGGTSPLSIGNFAFAGCRELKHLRLDNRVVQIHTGAFAACERLENVVFGTDQNAKRVAIDSNAFTSAQGTAVSALELVSGFMSETGDEASEFIPTANYDDEELQAFTNLTAMTPLRDAAFQNRPASTIKVASDASHSFPTDCVVHYPTADYNPSANSEWQGALDSDKTTWQGYPTVCDWGGHVHNYVITASSDATHTQDGSITYTCSICKDNYTENIPKGHDFEEYNRLEPTCTEDGVIVYHCKRDGCSYPNGFYYETLPALGHKDESFVTMKEPTCTEDGLRQGYCSRCRQNINEVIPAKGHNLAMMTVVKPKCDKDGYAYGRCVDCLEVFTEDDPIILPALGVAHKWDDGKVTTQPTCENTGVRTFTCTTCGDTKTETIPSLGHTTELQGVSEPTCTETGYTGDEVCTVCGAIVEQGTEIPARGHEYTVTTTPPTCTKQGYTTHSCINCDHVFVDSFVDPLGHQTELQNTKEPTCVEKGYTGDEICTVCGELVNRGEVTPATGHTLILENEIEATCTTNGYSGDQVCTVCGEIIKHGNVISATGHELEKENAVPVTCTHDGYTGDQVCTICNEIVNKGEVIPAKGHTPEKRGAKDPTCTEPGYTGDTYCSVCREKLSSGEAIPTLGHKWSEWTVTKPATETAEGEESRMCTRCHETDLRPIPKLEPTHCDGGSKCPSIKLTDVDRSPSSWYHEAVDWAYVSGVTQGTSTTLFSPTAACTRGQAVTFLWRALGSPEPKATKCDFVDVPSGAYYYKAVLWAGENGVTNGIDASHFGPDVECTRGHIVTFLYRAMKGVPVSNSTFSDVPASEWFADPVAWAVSKGITNGIGGGLFGPGNTCTRAHIVTFLYRAVKQ